MDHFFFFFFFFFYQVFARMEKCLWLSTLLITVWDWHIINGPNFVQLLEKLVFTDTLEFL